MKRSRFIALILSAVVGTTVFAACEPADRHEHDPNDDIELKPFSMLVDDEISNSNYYPFGIFAPTDWTQTGYDLKYTDGMNIYDYFMNEGQYEINYFSYELYVPYLSLKGANGEYAYGYADFGSSSVSTSISLDEYLDLFLRANDYDRPQDIAEITMTSWTPAEEKIKGLSFDMEFFFTTERIVVCKMFNPHPKDEFDCFFGVFHMGCNKDDYNGKKTLFDRMEESIFGYGVSRAERYEDDYFKNVKTIDHSALGLTMRLPNDYSPFYEDTFPAYASSYGTAYLVWSNTEDYFLEDAGVVKVEIWRDPVKFSDVFAPITNLYTLHEEDAYYADGSVAPPMLTTLSDGTIAVYSAHNSFKKFERLSPSGNPDYYSMYVEEAKRTIVYTFIHGEFIYNVNFIMTYHPVFNYGDIQCGPSVSYAMSALNTLEEYLVFNAMDSLKFN